MSSYSTHRKARNMGDAIRLFCLECQGSSIEFGKEYAAVRDCPCENSCSLWPYRFGKDPVRSAKAKARHAEAQSNTERYENVEPVPMKVSRTRR